MSHTLVTKSFDQFKLQLKSLVNLVAQKKTIKIAKKKTKDKKKFNGQKSHLFPILLTIATKQKHIQPYNLAILVDKAF